MTIPGVLLLAVLDSINPSAIVVTLYLLSVAGSRALGRVVSYLGAILVTYFLFGMMLILGAQSLVPSLGTLLDGPIGLAGQSLIGLALLIYGLNAPTKQDSPSPIRTPSARTHAAMVVLGVTVTTMEFPTAIPYFAAVALISEAELPAAVWLPLLGVYNAIFILPPVALLVGHLALRGRLATQYAALQQRLESSARETMLWVAGLVGTGLLVTGIIELVARLR